jgi:hypothetical protein
LIDTLPSRPLNHTSQKWCEVSPAPPPEYANVTNGNRRPTYPSSPTPVRRTDVLVPLKLVCTFSIALTHGAGGRVVVVELVVVVEELVEVLELLEVVEAVDAVVDVELVVVLVVELVVVAAAAIQRSWCISSS